MQSALLKIILFSILIGITKAHHFRMLFFAVLGLAGLWMVNSVAKSSGGGEERSQLFPNFSVASLANRFISKRSVEVERVPINWELVLTNDMSTCTRSYVCQLSASDADELQAVESVMLDLIRQSVENDFSWARKQIQQALRTGDKWKSKARCMKTYRKCPYTSATMLMLLNSFEERT